MTVTEKHTYQKLKAKILQIQNKTRTQIQKHGDNIYLIRTIIILTEKKQKNNNSVQLLKNTFCLILFAGYHIIILRNVFSVVVFFKTPAFHPQ